jgi:hypothetical protein
MGNDPVETPALRAVQMGLYPTLDSVSSVIDMGIAQLPIQTPNALISLLMTYHNTLITCQKETQHVSPVHQQHPAHPDHLPVE